MPRDSDYCGGGYETRISDNGTTTNTSWGDCGSGPVINITGGSNSSRDYPSGSGRGDHDGGGRGEQNSHENSHGTGGSGSSNSDRARARRNAEEKEKFESKLEMPQYAKGSDGVSMQAKGLIKDLDYQLNVSGFSNPKGLALPHCDLRDVDMGVIVQSLKPFQWNLTVIDFSNNGQLGDKAIENLFYTMGTHQVPAKFVQSFNLSNCNIGDYGAEYIAESLKSGRYPATKSIDLSGNKITPPGETKLVQALKGVGQDIAIFTHTLDEIVKMTDGSREEKVAIFRSLIEKGKAIGTYDEAIVVDKSFLGKLSNVKKEGLFGIEWLFGFGKCHLLPEPEKVVESYAQDKIIATLPTKTASGLNFAKKYVGKLLSFHDVITCFVSSREDALTSEMGQQVLAHELCLLGEEEFCGE